MAGSVSPRSRWPDRSRGARRACSRGAPSRRSIPAATAAADPVALDAALDRHHRQVDRHAARPAGLQPQVAGRRFPAEAIRVVGQQRVADVGEPGRVVGIAAERLRETFRIVGRERVDQLVGRGAGTVAPTHDRIEVVVGARAVPPRPQRTIDPEAAAVATAREQVPAPVQARRLRPRVEVEALVAGAVEGPDHRHQARVRHVVGSRPPEQDRRAVGMRDPVVAQRQVQRVDLVAEARADPAGQQVDAGQHAVAARRMEDDGAGSKGFVFAHARDSNRRFRRFPRTCIRFVTTARARRRSTAHRCDLRRNVH